MTCGQDCAMPSVRAAFLSRAAASLTVSSAWAGLSALGGWGVGGGQCMLRADMGVVQICSCGRRGRLRRPFPVGVAAVGDA